MQINKLGISEGLMIIKSNHRIFANLFILFLVFDLICTVLMVVFSVLLMYFFVYKINFNQDLESFCQSFIKLTLGVLVTIKVLSAQISAIQKLQQGTRLQFVDLWQQMVTNNQKFMKLVLCNLLLIISINIFLRLINFVLPMSQILYDLLAGIILIIIGTLIFISTYLIQEYDKTTWFALSCAFDALVRNWFLLLIPQFLACSILVSMSVIGHFIFKMNIIWITGWFFLFAWCSLPLITMLGVCFCQKIFHGEQQR